MLDQRKHPVRGLWRRNDRYYAQLTVEDPNTGVKRVKRVPLEEATTDAQAVAKLQEFLTQRRKGSLPVLKRTPKFADYAKEYSNYYKQAKDAKRESTLYTERLAVNHWIKHLGHVRLDRITRALVNSYIAKRQAGGLTGRTVNLEVICFRNVMKRAIDDGWIMSLPTQNLRPLKWTPRKRQLVSAEDIDRLCKATIAGVKAGEKFKNGQLFADYVRLMAYCGSRRNETLRLKWLDVDWQNHQLTIGSDGLAKNRQARVVDFNPKLAALLKDMESRRTPDSVWLFPSPQHGDEDRRTMSLVETMRLVRNKAQLPTFGFHDCRELQEHKLHASWKQKREFARPGRSTVLAFGLPPKGSRRYDGHLSRPLIE
jgi:integrase